MITESRTENLDITMPNSNNIGEIASYESKLVISFKLKAYDGCETNIDINIGKSETQISMYGENINNGETHFYIKATMSDADRFVLNLNNTINGHIVN